MYSFKDRLIDWANRQGAWTRILVTVGIVLVIIAIILGAAMPSKGEVRDNAAGVSGLNTTMVVVVNGLATKASRAELDSFSENVTGIFNSQASSISSLGTRMGNAETKINEAKSDIITIQGSLAELNSPPEAYLTGTFGNYTVHAECREAGNFTANVHLAYSAPIYVGNATTHNGTLSAFYSGINFTVAAATYIPVATFNGTAWGIAEVWWNIGMFELAANNETALNITCAGLNNTWSPSFTYVEIYPALR